jgi:hypothetical protein
MLLRTVPGFRLKLPQAPLAAAVPPLQPCRRNPPGRAQGGSLVFIHKLSVVRLTVSNVVLNSSSQKGSQLCWNMLRIQRYFAHKKQPPPQDPTVAQRLCPGTYGDPGAVAVSYERGTPVLSSVRLGGKSLDRKDLEGGKTCSLIRKHDHLTPTREIMRHVRALATRKDGRCKDTSRPLRGTQKRVHARKGCVPRSSCSVSPCLFFRENIK